MLSIIVIIINIQFKKKLICNIAHHGGGHTLEWRISTYSNCLRCSPVYSWLFIHFKNEYLLKLTGDSHPSVNIFSRASTSTLFTSLNVFMKIKCYGNLSFLKFLINDGFFAIKFFLNTCLLGLFLFYSKAHMLQIFLLLESCQKLVN